MSLSSASVFGWEKPCKHGQTQLHTHQCPWPISHIPSCMCHYVSFISQFLHLLYLILIFAQCLTHMSIYEYISLYMCAYMFRWNHMYSFVFWPLCVICDTFCVFPICFWYQNEYSIYMYVYIYFNVCTFHQYYLCLCLIIYRVLSFSYGTLVYSSIVSKYLCDASLMSSSFINMPSVICVNFDFITLYVFWYSYMCMWFYLHGQGYKWLYK